MVFMVGLPILFWSVIGYILWTFPDVLMFVGNVAFFMAVLYFLLRLVFKHPCYYCGRMNCNATCIDRMP